MTNDKYTVEMTEQQWDLVVLALDYVQKRAFDPAKPNDFHAIEVLRRFEARS